MKKILIILSAILVYQLSFSQNLDLIVKTNGDSIACKIDSLTESHIFFQIKTDASNKWIQTWDDLDDISGYEYNVIDERMFLFKSGTAVIVRKKESTKYKHLKGIYSPKDYVPAENDKYDPSLAGVLSLIPGLGLCYAGEPLRSLAYVGGMAGSFGAMVVGFGLAYGGSEGGVVLFFAGAGGIVFFYISSFISAIRVAKVKNLAIRDKAISFNFSPQIEIKNHLTPANTFGCRIAVSF